MKKNLDLVALIACAAALLAVVMWFVSYSTYPAAAVNSGAGTLFGICALALMGACALGVGDHRVHGLLILAAGLVLVDFFYQFVMGRVTITADAYFIPVNHPAEEDAAMSQTIAGLCAAFVSFVAITADAFMAKDE